ncbi:MAG TPA: hypothetical protein VIM38_07990, partial [Alphaproteobacteria bacterium]
LFQKRFVDIAATAETWARQQELGDEIIGYAHAFKHEALKWLAKMLKETPKNTGVRLGPVAHRALSMNERSFIFSPASKARGSATASRR